jgi:hypothetical protein
VTSESAVAGARWGWSSPLGNRKYWNQAAAPMLSAKWGIPRRYATQACWAGCGTNASESSNGTMHVWNPMHGISHECGMTAESLAQDIACTRQPRNQGRCRAAQHCPLSEERGQRASRLKIVQHGVHKGKRQKGSDKERAGRRRQREAACTARHMRTA